MTAPAAFAPYVAHDVVPGVRRVTAPNPGRMTGPGTNTYLVGDRDVVVVDPGPDDEGHLRAVVAACAARVSAIVTTHTHPDHAPGAARLHRLTGAPLLGFERRDGFDPTRLLRDGASIGGGHLALRAVHTPGHASNHLCFWLRSAGVLFSGDHVMQGSTVVISPPDGDMAAYLASLRRLLRFPLRAIAPGHGALITDPATVVREYLDHRLARERQVLDALRAGVHRIDDVVELLYADVHEELRPMAARSVHAHLRKLRDDGLVRGRGARGPWYARRAAAPGRVGGRRRRSGALHG